MILCIGDLMLDVLLLSQLRVEEQGEGIVLRGGGSAANTAAWLATLGVQCRFAGVAADSALGHALVDELRAAGVEVLVNALAGEEDGCVAVEISPAGERVMRSSRGANQALGVRDVLAAADPELSWVHLTGYSLLGPPGFAILHAAAEIASASGARLSFDPSSPGVIRRLGAQRLLRELESAGVYLVLPNAPEALDMTSLSDVPAAAGHLATRLPWVVVKNGSRGAWYAMEGLSGSVPTVEVVPTDTTGAGDAFNAGLLAALLRGEDLEAACGLAHETARSAICRYGGRPPSRRND